MTLLAVLKGLWSFLLRYWKEIGMLILILLLCAQVEKCTAAKYELKIAEMKADAMGDYVQAQEAARKQEQEWSALVAVIDQNGQQALREKEDEIAKLRAAVESGSVRLRIAAKCPGRVPEAAASPGMGDGGAAELADSARPDYFSLRSGIVRQREQLLACQAILRAERGL